MGKQWRKSIILGERELSSWYSGSIRETKPSILFLSGRNSLSMNKVTKPSKVGIDFFKSDSTSKELSSYILISYSTT